MSYCVASFPVDPVAASGEMRSMEIEKTLGHTGGKMRDIVNLEIPHSLQEVFIDIRQGHVEFAVVRGTPSFIARVRSPT